MNQSQINRIAVFASGGGSNALRIFEHFENHDSIEVALCLTNNKEAGVLQHAISFDVPYQSFSNDDFKSGEIILNCLEEEKIDYIVLAGFLRKIPTVLLERFEDKIINIHPALLPNYGGKGMYGMNVHRAVKENKEAFSGPTIHLVNENYDEGAILAQFQVALSENDSVETIQMKVLKLEHQYFAKVIESYILQQK